MLDCNRHRLQVGWRAERSPVTVVKRAFGRLFFLLLTACSLLCSFLGQCVGLFVLFRLCWGVKAAQWHWLALFCAGPFLVESQSRMRAMLCRLERLQYDYSFIALSHQVSTI